MSVLIVEPELAIRHPIAEYLRECGFRVYEATDTDEATAIISELHGELGVVICDALCNGKYDGFGLAKWVREHHNHIEFVLSTGADRTAKRAAALCETTTLAKPYDHQMLLDRIKRMMAARDQARLNSPARSEEH